MILGRHDLHGLTGVYAVDALAGAERDQFEFHLNRCQQCANEVRGFRETTTRLALAVAATPPAGLRERVLAAVAITRQLPPEMPEAAARRSQPSRSARSIGRGWYPRLATAVAVAALAAAVALGITQATTQHQLNQAQAQNQAVASVLAAPDAQLASRSTLAGGLATVVVSRSRHALVITTSGLPALTGGKVYELWYLAPGNVRPAGLLPAVTHGQTAPLLAAHITAGDKMALTVEPAGGTSHPTTTPILVMSLPA